MNAKMSVMKHKLNTDERGAVALITVIFMAILLTIVTTSFIRITINEARQATDDDLTKRAFFAAESGVEDAKAALDRYLSNEIQEADLNGDDCDAPTGIDPIIEDVDGIEASYTCALIDLISPAYEAAIPAWESRSIPLQGVDATEAPTDFNSVTISWHDPNENGTYALRNSADISLPQQTAWASGGNSFPAMMRIQISSYPETATFGGGAADTFVAFVNPSNGGANPANNILVNDGAIISNGSCTPSVAAGYACSVTLTGFDDPNRNYSVRVTPLYGSTNMQLVLDGGATDLEGAQATIDVTGRAGDVFRRVEVRVSLAGVDYLPDAALTSGRDLCKEFNITDETIDSDPTDGLAGFLDINFGPDPFASANGAGAVARPNTLCQD